MTLPIPSSAEDTPIELYHEALGVAAEEQKASIHGRLGELLLQIRHMPPRRTRPRRCSSKIRKNGRAMTVQAKALYGQARLGTFPGKPGEVGASFETARRTTPASGIRPCRWPGFTATNHSILARRPAPGAWPRREKAADQIIDRLVAAHPDRPDAHLARYQYRLQYRLPGADDDLKEARRLGRENPDVLLASAEAFRREALDAAPSAAADGIPAQCRPKPQCRPGPVGFVEPVPTTKRPSRWPTTTIAATFGLGETLWDLGQSQAAIDAWQRGLAVRARRDKPLRHAAGQRAGEHRPFRRGGKAPGSAGKSIRKIRSRQVPYEKGLSVRKYRLIRARWLRGKNRPSRPSLWPTA